MTKKKNYSKTIFKTIFFILLIAFGGFVFLAYKVLYYTNIDLKGNHSAYIFIPTGSDYQDVLRILEKEDIVVNIKTFEWLAEKKNYRNHVRAGRYEITTGMGNNELINLLRSGQQKPIMLTISNIRTKEQLAGRVSKIIEADSLSLITKLNNTEILADYGFTPEDIKLMFLPNSYELFWNTSAKQFFDRMNREYQRFWNDERMQKAYNMNMTPMEIGVLASIVQLETNKRDEMSRIAGVYINRLNRNMALQADPTVVFAYGDFTINRVLNRHLQIDSPYNTYMHRGLPPGPITFPEPTTIDYVLNYEKHNYLYFSAKEDFSGYHNFARTHSEHIANARKYRQALNERKIMN